MENLHFSYPPDEYEPHYESSEYQNPVTQHSIGQEWRFDDRCGRYNSFNRPLSTNHYPYNPNRKRDNWNIRRGRGKVRNHLDDIYLPNYDDELTQKSHIQDHMKNRHYWNHTMSRGRNRKFTSSSTRTVSQRYGMRTKGKQTLASDRNFSLNEDNQCMETTSSVNVDNEICATKSIINCANNSVVEVESRKKSAPNINSHLKSHTGAICLEDSSHNDLESQMGGKVNSNSKKQMNKISKQSNDKKKTTECSFTNVVNTTTRHNSSMIRDDSNNDATYSRGDVEPKDSTNVPVCMTKLINSNLLPCDKENNLKIYTNIANSDSISTNVQSTKHKGKYTNPKHSTTVTVEKCPHQKDPRLAGLTTKNNEIIILKKLEWKDTKKSKNKQTLDNKLHAELVSLNDETKTSVTIDTSEFGHSSRLTSKHKKSKSQCDSKQNNLGVSNSQTSEKIESERIERNTSFKTGKKVENLIPNDTRKKEYSINQQSLSIKRSNKKTKYIMTKEFVCQYNRSILTKFCGNSFPTLQYCCHVYIQRGECNLYNKSYKNETNIFDNIDTKKSYLLQRNTNCCNDFNLRENSRQNVLNRNNTESKQEADFDKNGQDEEMKFLPVEIEQSGSNNSTQDIVNKPIDDIIIVADKIVPKKLFMDIYKTKPNKVSGTRASVDQINYTAPVNENGKMDKKNIAKPSVKRRSLSLDHRIKKKLYDPVYDSKVSEGRLLELFDDDLSDLILDSNDSLADKAENFTRSKFFGKSNFKRKYPFNQMSLTCEDVYATPKKITNRRKTTAFSSFLEKNTDTKDDTSALSPRSDVIATTTQLTANEIAMTKVSNHSEKMNQVETPKNTSKDIKDILSDNPVPPLANVIAESKQLLANEIAMTNVSNHSEKINQVETPKNTSQDIINILSGSPVPPLANFIEETKQLLANEIEMTNLSFHSEETNKFETPKNTSQDINILSCTNAVSPSANVIVETIEFIAKEIAMTNVNNNFVKAKQVPTSKNESQDVINILGGPTITPTIVSEAHSSQDQQITVHRNKNKISKITRSPSYPPENILEITEVLSSPTNKNRQTMSVLIEKKVPEKNTGKRHRESESSKNLKDFKKLNKKHCDKVKTNKPVDVFSEMGIKSNCDSKEFDVNIENSNAPFNYNEVKRKKLSMPLLFDTKTRQIEQKSMNDREELTLKFAKFTKTKDKCCEVVVSIYDRPSIEPSFALPSEVPEYRRKAVSNSTIAQYSEKAQAIRKPEAPPSSQQAPESSGESQLQNPPIYSVPLQTTEFYPDELGKIYFWFYDYVVYILKGYIPLQRAYSDSYKLIFDTLRRFPHSLNNFSSEGVSLELILHDRRKSYGRHLLVAILKLPTHLPHFNFTHFLRITTQLLNKSRIVISIPVIVQHLLTLMIACNYDYKQNKTSDKFKKTLESFSDTLNNKSDSSQPEFGLTQRQSFHLKSQILTYIQLTKNQAFCLGSGKQLEQAVPSGNANSNNQQIIETSRRGNCTDQTQHPPIRNCNKSERSSKTMRYLTLENLLNDKCSDSAVQNTVSNTRYITSQGCQQPPPYHQCTSDPNNSTFVNRKISKNSRNVKLIGDASSNINSVTKNSPVNKMTDKEVISALPKTNSSVCESRISYSLPNSLQTVEKKINSTVQSCRLQKSPSLPKTLEDFINKALSESSCSLNNKVDTSKYVPSDSSNCSTNLTCSTASTVSATKESASLFRNDCIPHVSIISNPRQDEDNSISKRPSIGVPQGNESQLLAISSASEVRKPKTQSSEKNKSVDANPDNQYVNKEETTLNKINEDILNETKKYESSDSDIANNVDLTSSDVIIKEENVENPKLGEDEIIDLTWIDDFTEDELTKEDNGNEFICIKNEPLGTCTEAPSSPGDSGIDSPPIQMEYPMLILENRLCLCGQMAVYLCHCNTAMYCSQKCQLNDWPKHRRSCHSTCAT